MYIDETDMPEPPPPQPERVSEQEAKRRERVALAKIRELEAAEKAGLLIDAAEVREAWVSIAARVRDALLAVPDKCAPAITGATGADAAQVRAVLLAEIENILRQLHDDLQPAN